MNNVAPPKNLKELLGIGYQALSTGQFNKAIECAKMALQVDRELVPAHFLIGLVAKEMQKTHVAFSAFQSVVKLDKYHAGGWSNLANQYMKMGMVKKAEDAIQELRRIRSDDPMVLNLLGETLTLMSEHQLANSCFARAHTIQNKNIFFLHNLANNLVFLGEKKEAEKLFKHIIEMQEDSPQAHWAMSSAIKAKDSAHIEKMKALAANRQNNPNAFAFYQYAIGKEYEDLQEWDSAFEAFALGAKAKRSIMQFDENEEIKAFDYLEKHIDENWLKKGGEGCLDDAPIFVLGQPRTGTTLIERIITAHSDVHSAGELQQFRLALMRLSKEPSSNPYSVAAFKAAKDADPLQLGNLYLQTSGRMRGTTSRFVDKLPQNYKLLPFILKALPNAKIVHLVRDPMDASFASFKQLFADTYAHSYEQSEMARHHVRYLKLMKVWRDRFGDRFLDISYEQTARDLEPNAKALINFLDLDWQDACLEFHKQDSAVSTASASQVREPAHTRSIGRWRRYEKQLSPMLSIMQENDVALID